MNKFLDNSKFSSSKLAHEILKSDSAKQFTKLELTKSFKC